METAASDCKTLFLLFYDVLRFSEGLSSATDSKILFKGAQIIENMCLKTVSLQAVNEFESKLEEFWTFHGLENVPLVYFKNASHLILHRFLSDSKFSNSEVQLAIKEFISYKSEEDFFEVVKNLSKTQHNVKCVMEKIDNEGTILKYKALIFMEELKRLLIDTNGRVDQVFASISNGYGNDKESFTLLLKVLCLHNYCELTRQIQELVLLFVCDCMKDCEKTYIYSCILDLDNEEFNVMLVRWNSFTATLVKLMDFAVRGLKCEYLENSFSWKYLGEEKGLSFDQLVVLINKLKGVQEKFDYLQDILDTWRNENYAFIIEDLLRICKIK